MSTRARTRFCAPRCTRRTIGRASWAARERPRPSTSRATSARRATSSPPSAGSHGRKPAISSSSSTPALTASRWRRRITPGRFRRRFSSTATPPRSSAAAGRSTTFSGTKSFPPRGDAHAEGRSAALLVSCAGGNPFPPATIDLGQVPPDAPRGLSLSLDEKIGQLFVVPAHGVYLSEQSKDFQTLRHHVVDNHVGGVILFRSNVYGAAVLVGKLQELARVPLLVSADLEAGLGMRFEDVTYGPWAMAIAAAGDPTLAERVALATAREARAIGIAQVFAPVADVNVNPDNPVINVRSFGEDPGQVSRYVEATVKGLKDGGVLATLKHFPGHGDTTVDSHRALAIVGADRPRFESVELVSFRAGIKAGAESVMIAHLSIPDRKSVV